MKFPPVSLCTRFHVVLTSSTRKLSSRTGWREAQLHPMKIAQRYSVSSDFEQESSKLDETQASGDDFYKRALDALEAAEALEETERRKKSEEQFQAWKRAQERPSRSEGVAVVKTIARQTKREKELVNEQGEEKRLRMVAKELMEQAAFQHGHGKALVRLGNTALDEANVRTEKGSGNDKEKVESLVREALHLYEMAGKSGAAEGWFNLGHLLWTGYPQSDSHREVHVNTVVDPDRRGSMEAFERAIGLNDPDAMYFVGVHFLSSDDPSHTSDQDSQVREGFDLVQKAADLSHGGALYYLALLYRNGRDELGILPCTPAEFVRRLDVAAAVGDPDALFLRGHCYYHGEDGYAQDYQMALSDFMEAAKRKNADAAVSAGAMLHRGQHEGIKQDQSKAFELYQWAGELGSMEGWRNVVACYAQGEGVPKCERTAEYIAKTMLDADRK